jgi:hypothetical protein
MAFGGFSPTNRLRVNPSKSNSSKVSLLTLEMMRHSANLFGRLSAESTQPRHSNRSHSTGVDASGLSTIRPQLTLAGRLFAPVPVEPQPGVRLVGRTGLSLGLAQHGLVVGPGLLDRANRRRPLSDRWQNIY